jgi:signal transduction histidine kinase
MMQWKNNDNRSVVKRPKLKQLLLFAAVLLVPITAVIIQATQMSRYRAREMQADAAQQVGQLMIDELSQITFGAYSWYVAAVLAETEASIDIPRNIVVIGIQEDGQLTWLWDRDAAACDRDSADEDTVSAQRQFDAARDALAEGRQSDARQIYSELIGDMSSNRSNCGVPDWAGAAVGLLNLAPGSMRAAILERITSELAHPVNRYHAAQLRLVLGLLAESSDPTVQTRAETLSALTYQRSTEFDDLGDVQRRYPSFNIEPGSWQAYEASSLWLVGMSSLGPESSPPILVVDARSLLQSAVPSAARLEIVLGTGEGLPLDDRLMGLRVSIPAESSTSFVGAAQDLPSMQETTVALAILLALFGAYFLWRDTNRDRAIAELRAQFVSGVSHELKTPLTSIRMFAETIQIADEAGIDTTEKRAEYLDTIIRESERLTRLLNNVLAFSQIERGRRNYQMQREDLRQIVDNAVDMLRFPLHEKGFTLDVSKPDKLPLVAADRDAIEQAILNLLSNAIKYSGNSRRIELAVSLEESEAVISVRDHGIGIPEKERTRIFDSFYRVSGNESQAISGTGLGLAIVDHIVRAHGGSIAVESELEKGSAFYIRLPIED